MTETAAKAGFRHGRLRFPPRIPLMPLVTVAVLLIVVALPLMYVVMQAIFPDLTSGSLANPFSKLVSTLLNAELAGLIGNTLMLGLAVVTGCAALAIPLGALRALTRIPGGAFWDLVFLIPFMIPPYIAALAWMMSLQSGGYSEQLLGLDGDSFLFSFPGIVFVMVLNVFPVVYFAVSRTLMAVGGRFASAGRVCGAGSWSAFLRLTLPLSTPGIAASLLLAFALTIEEFGTPATLGTQAGFDVVVTGIHQRFADWPLDIPGAASLSLVLVLLAMAAFYLQHWLVTRRSYESMTSKPSIFERAELGKWRWPAFSLFAATGLLSVFIPVLAVLASAMTNTISGGLVWDNLSLRHFEALFANRSGALEALGTSLGFASATAVITGIIGALAGYILVRGQTRGKSLLDVLTMLPNTMPGIVVAVGLILAWNQDFWPVDLYGTSAMLLLAYVCLLLPYPVRYASASFRQMSINLEHAARVCGAGLGRTFISVLMPALLPSLTVAMLLVFAIASRELVASLMVAPAGTSTVSTFIFGQFEQGSPGIGMAMSVVAIFTTTLMLVLVTWMTRDRVTAAG